MTRYETNDGTMVNTNISKGKWNGAYKNGKIYDTLYLDYTGMFYRVVHADNTAEWYCDELACTWFRDNGIWNLPSVLLDTGKEG